MKANGDYSQLERLQSTGKDNGTSVYVPWLAVFICVISTGSCLCTVILYYEVQCLRQELERLNTPDFISDSSIKSSVKKTSLDNGQFSEISETGQVHSRMKRATMNTNEQHCSCLKGEKGSQGRKGKKGKRGRKGKRGQKGPKGDKGEKGETADIDDINLPIRLQTSMGELRPLIEHVHFISDYQKDVSSEGFKGNSCQLMFAGKVCRNRSFTATEKVPQIFRFLKNRDERMNVASLPVSQLDDGKYHIHKSGTYIVYLHAAVWSLDNTGRDVFAVVLDRRLSGRPSTVFHCRPLNNSWTGNHYDNLLQTCVSARILYLRTNDVISIYLQSVQAEIDLSKGETYFGFFRLA